MSGIDKKRDEIASIAREMKEETVRSTHDPDPRTTNIHNAAHGWRGDDLVVAIHPIGLSTETALDAARVAATGFGCDALALTTETYVAGVEVSPLTGKRWAPGEMQRAVEDHRALETGAVIEALATFVVNRAGDVASTTDKYRIHRRTNGLGIVSYDIEWMPVGTAMSDWDGLAVRWLTHFMNEIPVDTRLARYGINPATDFDLNADQARTHIDCGVVKALYRSGFDGSVMLLVRSGDTQRADIIKKSLGDYVRKV